MSSWLLLRDAIAHGARMTALQVFSNRLIRYSVPCWLLLMLFTSAALSAESRWFAWILIAQVAFYLVAGLGWAADAVRLPVPKMLLVPAYFVMVNSAAALAIAGLSGGQVSLWTKQR